MLGRRSIDLVHPDDRESTLRVVDELHAGTDQFAFENRYVRKDGTTAHIMWSARWSKFDNFRVAVARDISERKRAQARQEAIYAISDVVHSDNDLPSVFRRVLAILSTLMSIRTFCIALADPDPDAESARVDHYVDRSDTQAEAPPPNCIQLTREEIGRAHV